MRIYTKRLFEKKVQKVAQGRLKSPQLFHSESELLHLDNKIHIYTKQQANPITNCLTGLLTGSSRVISLSQPRNHRGKPVNHAPTCFSEINVSTPLSRFIISELIVFPSTNTTTATVKRLLKFQRFQNIFRVNFPIEFLYFNHMKINFHFLNFFQQFFFLNFNSLGFSFF